VNYQEIEAIYQELANKFVEIIPVKWDKLLFNSEVEEGAISTHYIFCESESKSFKDATSLTDEYGIDRKKRKYYSVELSRIVKRLHQAFVNEGQEKWNILTLILENDGRFKFDFEYVDLEETSSIERRNVWEKKYLH